MTAAVFNVSTLEVEVDLLKKKNYRRDTLQNIKQKSPQNAILENVKVAHRMNVKEERSIKQN